MGRRVRVGARVDVRRGGRGEGFVCSGGRGACWRAVPVSERGVADGEGGEGLRGRRVPARERRSGGRAAGPVTRPRPAAGDLGVL